MEFCYIFFKNLDSLKEFYEGSVDVEGFSIEQFFILRGKIKCKNGLFLGEDGLLSYGLATVDFFPQRSKNINFHFISPSEIEEIEWNHENRLKRAVYFGSFYELSNYITKTIL